MPTLVTGISSQENQTTQPCKRDQDARRLTIYSQPDSPNLIFFDHFVNHTSTSPCKKGPIVKLIGNRFGNDIHQNSGLFGQMEAATAPKWAQSRPELSVRKATTPRSGGLHVDLEDCYSKGPHRFHTRRRRTSGHLRHQENSTGIRAVQANAARGVRTSRGLWPAELCDHLAPQLGHVENH